MEPTATEAELPAVAEEPLEEGNEPLAAEPAETEDEGPGQGRRRGRRGSRGNRRSRAEHEPRESDEAPAVGDDASQEAALEAGLAELSTEPDAEGNALSKPQAPAAEDERRNAIWQSAAGREHWKSQGG